MRSLLKVIFHPSSSVLILAVLWLLFQRANLIFRVLTLFFGSVCYMALRPRARRNVNLWSRLAPEGATTRVGEGSRSIDSVTRDTSCIVVSVPIESDVDILSHALAFGKTTIMSQSTVMYVCRDLTDRIMFWMPLTRLVLWFMGGLVEYSRGLLLQLLKRKTANSGSTLAIVLLPPIRKTGEGRSVDLHHNKGIFAAAIKTGAVVVPALVSKTGMVDYGACQAAIKPTPLPTPDQVQQLAALFASELVALHEKVTGKTLSVSH